MRDDIFEEEIEDSKTLRFSPRWGRIILILLIGIALWAAYYAYCHNTYHHYEIQTKTKRPSSENTNYLSLEGKLFSYSRDGASLSAFGGNVAWNESFDMDNPTCETSGGYVLVYDRESTSANIFNSGGLVGSLSMTLPIIRASIAGNGNVAVLMQNGEKAYLRMYNPSGSMIASGEVHAKNTGYPIAMALSSDATRLMVSLLDLNDGDVKTTLCFYDFSDPSDDDSNHIAANFSYADQMIPEVTFLRDGAVAFGDQELIFFSTGKEIAVRKEVFLPNEINTVFYSADRVAVITSRETAKEKKENVLYVYAGNGVESFERKIRGKLTSAEFMSNGEILLHNGKNIRIYRDDGVQKFAGRADDSVRAVFPWDGQRNYYFITKDQSQKII